MPGKNVSWIPGISLAAAVAWAAPVHADAPAAHDFIAEARTLLTVGACADGPAYEPAKDIVAAYCAKVRPAQAEFQRAWIAPARAFFAEHVPADLPKVLVYPFAGGDLATALTVDPDADEIVTLALEPAGDPEALQRLPPKDLAAALAQVAKELGSLYKSTYSITMSMIETMRGGKLPTQLIFSLSALALHGYEPLALYYFRLGADGTIHYLTDADVAAIDAKRTTRRNYDFANVELHFRKIGGKREQIYRHIVANLDDKHIKASPGALRFLEQKGHVAAMTKAASYLLSFDDFSMMRKYIVDHVVWMVSDTTGLAPTYGTPAGFVYETWGEFDRPNMPAGLNIAPSWKKEYAAEPARPLAFRFGYPDGKNHGHLIFMKRAAAR